MYYRVVLEAVPKKAEEWISSWAFECGASGVAENLSFEQPAGEETVTTLVRPEQTLDIYFPQQPGDVFFNELKNKWPTIRIDWHCEQERDWLEEWKKNYQPFELSSGIWVVPSWKLAPPEARDSIFIDPGMAFGTGTHETTQLAAQVLPECVGHRPQSLLDVGTGTGILAILASKLGVPHIEVTELDEVARQVARENFALNNCQQIKFIAADLANAYRQYDVVVANIIDGVLIRLQRELQQLVQPGGWLILSGIVDERWDHFSAEFVWSHHFARPKHVKKGDWYCVWSQRLE